MIKKWNILLLSTLVVFSLIPFPCSYGFKTMEEAWKKKKKKEGYVTSNPLDVFTMWKTVVVYERVKEIDFATSWKTFWTPLAFPPLSLSPLFFLLTDITHDEPFFFRITVRVSRGMQSFWIFFTVKGFAETTLPIVNHLVLDDEGNS